MKIGFVIIIISFIDSILNNPDYEYELTSGSSLFFPTLSKPYIYKFYIPSKFCQRVDIEFTKNDDLSTNYQSIIIYEYSNRASETELKKTNTYLSYKSSYNSYSKSYTINYTDTNYLAFEISPYYEMVFVYVKATVISPVYEYELSDSVSKYFSILYPGCIYKFYISTQYDQILDIEFSKNDSKSTSYQYITIYEYSSESSRFELSRKNHSLSYDSTKNAYLYSYYVSQVSTSYLAFEIRPYYEMTSVNVKVTKEKSTVLDKVQDSQVYIPIIVGICLFIILIIICYFRYRRKQKQNNKIDFTSPSVQSLFSQDDNKGNNTPDQI